MKINKLISKSLIFSLLSSNILIFSNANEIPNRYQTLEGEYVTIDDSMEGNLEEIEIFGNTIQDDSNLKDIQSVGDLHVDKDGNPILDNQGREQYKIDIISNSKNLFNEKNFISKEHSSYRVITFDKKITVSNLTRYNYIHEVIGSIVLNKGTYTWSAVNVEYDATTYTLLELVNSNYSGIRIAPSGTRKTTFEVFEDNTLFDIRIDTGWNHAVDMPTTILFNIQLEKDKISSEYFPYQENKTTILLPTQLQKVGDIADRLYWDNNKKRYIIEKNIEKVIIDGSYKWNIIETRENVVYLNLNGELVLPNRLSTNSPVISEWNQVSWTSDEEGINAGFNFDILIRKNKLSDISIQSIQEFLNKNTFSVYYQLKNTKIIETNITSKLKIPTYNEKTYIYVDSENGINPTLKVTIDRLPQIAKNSVEEAKINPNTYNISLSRMYINMLPESLYKDQLQEQLSEIFSSDTVLDKKSVTANLDLYIKSENALIINLNTNFITFEDFSGIEDMAKENAVQINISSSLPYQLNAYLPTEIQNADKSNIMDRRILNIKENSENEYKFFTNINEKVILKDNCSSGNNLVHNIDIKLKGDITHKKDIYKTTIKFEVQQK